MANPSEPEMTLAKVVVRYPDGRLVKGFTGDFSPHRETFHVHEAGVPSDTPPREINLAELKAVFFVKSLDGDIGHAKSNLFDPTDRTPGRKIRVLFKDGEELRGYSPDFLSTRAGFFLLPADLRSNADLFYVDAAATEKVSLITPIL